MSSPEQSGPIGQVPALPVGNEVQVVLAEWMESPELEERFLAVLSDDERARAARFRVTSARTSFVAGRGLLRLLLGSYLGEKPDALHFAEGPHGKPTLAPPHDRAGLYFSVSHSDRLLAYAFARQPCIGVDVERIRSDLDHEGMAPRTFSPGMFPAWHALAGPDRRTAFFLNWTRKEAVVKATGAGLSLPLETLDVSFVPGDPARLLRTEEHGPVDAWHLLNIDALPDYACAVAMRLDDGSGVEWRKVQFIASDVFFDAPKGALAIVDTG